MANFPGRSVTAVLLGGILLSTAAGPAMAAPRGVPGQLLPVPAGGSVTAVDVSPLGVVAGTQQVVTTNPDGTQTLTESPQRWARLPRAGWVRQQLTMPAGATSGTAAALTDLGEAAGAVTLDGVSRAVRWSLDGRTATLIGEARSRVSAAGPAGPWGVLTGGTDAVGITGESELVDRAGGRTPLRGTPELEAGYRRTVSSIAGPDTAVVWVVNGIGRGTTGRPLLWQAGATVPLPVVSSFGIGPSCVSRALPGGTVVASGYNVDNGSVSWVMVKHTGGVPGTTVELNRAVPGQPVAGLTCGPDQPSPGLAPDGAIAGFVTEADVRHAAYWDPAGVVQVVPLAAGERSATGVAAAAGGRMVIRSEGEDGTVRLSLWRAGNRTPLAVPAGWTVDSVVELTSGGLLVANLRNAEGTVRPAAWTVPTR